MRRSERDARLGELSKKLFAGASNVLELGTGSAVGEPSAVWAPSGRYAAALWRMTSDTTNVVERLRRLRRALSPGAAVLLVAPERAPLFTQLRSAVSGESAPRASLEPLCTGLLLAGFAAPRVHDLLPGHLVVSAQLPAALDTLDDFFEQPATH